MDTVLEGTLGPLFHKVITLKIKDQETELTFWTHRDRRRLRQNEDREICPKYKKRINPH